VARSYPRSRAMGETVREVVARILVEEVSDPRLFMVTVTGVDVSPDLRYATVFVTAHGDEATSAAALAGLDSAKGRIRSLLSSRLTTRFAPELQFRSDPAIEEAARIGEAIRREREAGRGSAEPNETGDGSGGDA
jgi:ribosome-binding factor A